MPTTPQCVTIAALGAAVRVEIDHGPLADWFAQSYPTSDRHTADVVLTAARSETGWTCVGPDGQMQLSDARVVAWISGQLNAEASKSLATTHVATHAAAVTRDGQVVMAAGRSGAGKSTLTAALVADGWQLLTDEVVATDVSTGMITTYPRPIGLKTGSWDYFAGLRAPDDLGPFFTDQLFLTPEALGGRFAPAGPSRAPALVVFPNRSSDLTAPQRVSPARATQQLLLHSYKAAVEPDQRLGTLATIASNAQCFEVDTTDLGAAVSFVDHAVSVEALT